MAKEIDRKELEFITDEMPVVWAKLKSPDKADEYGRIGYAITVSDPCNGSIVDYLKSDRNKDLKRALATLGEAVTDKRAIPKETYSGAKALFKTDDEKEYLAGRVYFAAQNLRKPEDIDVKTKEGREQLKDLLLTLEPTFFKLNENGKRIPAEAAEIYPTCTVRVRGYVYHSDTWGRYCIGLRAILLCKPGDGKFKSGQGYDADDDDKLNAVAEAEDQFEMASVGAGTSKSKASEEIGDDEIPF